MKIKLIIILSIFLLINEYSFGQNVEVDISTCRGMFNILKAMKDGESKQKISSMLDSILLTKPYRVMFKHYNRSWRPNHLPKEVFKRMILSLQFDSVYTKGENQRADQMLLFWIKFYNNLSMYSQNLHQLEISNLKKLVNDGVAFAQSWLPPDWHIPDFYLTIHPNGGSIAFAIDTAQGYDFLQLPRDTIGNIEVNELIGTVSHESHHLGMKTIYPLSMSSSDSVAFKFISLFIAEGTATKLINNYPGGCVPVIDELRPTTVFDNTEIRKWWTKYTSEELEIFNRFVETFDRAYSGNLSMAALQNEISQFWLSGYVSPVYFIGSELFGAIYHGFGKQGVFISIQDPRQIMAMYNKAINTRPDILSHCYKIPDYIVQQGLAIGTIR